MSHDFDAPVEVSCSSRHLMEVLAGRIELDKFLEEYGLAPKGEAEDYRQRGTNPFAQAYNSGRLITHVSVEHLDDKDDDVITFRFGDPDPAIAPFSVPRKPDENINTDTV